MYSFEAQDVVRIEAVHSSTVFHKTDTLYLSHGSLLNDTIWSNELPPKVSNTSPPVIRKIRSALDVTIVPIIKDLLLIITR